MEKWNFICINLIYMPFSPTFTYSIKSRDNLQHLYHVQCWYSSEAAILTSNFEANIFFSSLNGRPRMFGICQADPQLADQLLGALRRLIGGGLWGSLGRQKALRWGWGNMSASPAPPPVLIHWASHFHPPEPSQPGMWGLHLSERQ